MVRQRGQSRSEPPTEDEVLRNQVWQLGYLLDRLKGRAHFYVNGLAGELEVMDVQNFSDELTPKVIVLLEFVDGKDSAVAEEPSEGTVRNERQHQQSRKIISPE